LKKIKISNTINIPIGGKPVDDIVVLKQGEFSGVKPSLIPFITPKLAVKVGDEVKIGSAMFFDKKDTDLLYLSPTCGVVEEIVYGDKRSLSSVIIKNNGKTDTEEKQSFSDISSIDVDTLRKAICQGGLWGIFKEFPFNNIPKTDSILPESIYVSLDNDEPFHPKSEVYLQDNLDDFSFGLDALKKLFTNVYMGVPLKSKSTQELLEDHITHKIKGHYPANQSDTLLYKNKTSSDDNNSFGIFGQDLIRLGYLLKNGKYPNTKIITLGGSILKKPTHLEVIDGESIANILKDEDIGDARVIAGGVFKGRTSCLKGYVGFNEYAIHILSEDLKQDLFGFMKPGFFKPTNSRTYMSFLNPFKNTNRDVSLYGEDRSCINCDFCYQVCPVDLQPQFIMKELYAKDVPNALSMGMLDCNSCGVCTYVCPSKIELSDIITTAKDDLYKELSK